MTLFSDIQLGFGSAAAWQIETNTELQNAFSTNFISSNNKLSQSEVPSDMISLTSSWVRYGVQKRRSLPLRFSGIILVRP